MLEFLKNNKKTIIRVVGALMLVVGFAVHFWTVPKEGVSKEELAAANVARMEASVSGTPSSTKQGKPTESPFMKQFQDTRQKHIQYLTIAVMIVGAGFLLYSFIKKEEE